MPVIPATGRQRKEDHKLRPARQKHKTLPEKQMKSKRIGV
jgi:hypothetical protein